MFQSPIYTDCFLIAAILASSNPGQLGRIVPPQLGMYGSLVQFVQILSTLTLKILGPFHKKWHSLTASIREQNTQRNNKRQKNQKIYFAEQEYIKREKNNCIQ